MSEWLEHGGQLRRAARHYGIAEARWLDLSTGIAPYTLALPELPALAASPVTMIPPICPTG